MIASTIVQALTMKYGPLMM